MADALHVSVYDKKVLVFSEELEGSVELGRQSDTREELYSRKFDAGRWRVAIAGAEENAVSRRHAVLELLSEGKIRLTNASTVIPLRLPGGVELGPKMSSEV